MNMLYIIKKNSQSAISFDISIQTYASKRCQSSFTRCLLVNFKLIVLIRDVLLTQNFDKSA